MPNRSHYNSAHRMMNYLRKEGTAHSADAESQMPDCTYHAVLPDSDCVELLKTLDDNSVQLMVCDPPYNLNIADWDEFNDYIEWAAQWLAEVPRVLKKSGSIVIFGGFQYQSDYGGDLLEIMHYVRHNVPLRMVNLIIWYYKNGMGAHRFFSNRHEEIVWYTKTKKYLFNLDAVRVQYDEATKKAYLKDKRLRPESVEKGKNPTNVWEIPRLNGNSKERVGHETQKPVQLIDRIVKAMSNPGDLVLDFFAGSGSTTVASILNGRHSIASDLDPNLREYVDRLVEKKAGGEINPLKFELLDASQIDTLFEETNQDAA
ncbi:Adenine-specific methyltransferase (EC [Olavius sp. associated proteobacterium Delta 1]|nr:Adenine-specific methyltransferase (EC [Olavius sp. associated proteobacterium Delta 1]